MKVNRNEDINFSHPSLWISVLNDCISESLHFPVKNPLGGGGEASTLEVCSEMGRAPCMDFE